MSRISHKICYKNHSKITLKILAIFIVKFLITVPKSGLPIAEQVDLIIQLSTDYGRDFSRSGELQPGPFNILYVWHLLQIVNIINRQYTVSLSSQESQT